MEAKKTVVAEKKGLFPQKESQGRKNAVATFSYRAMAKAAFGISFLTVLSKLFGFGREVAFAAVFGAGAQMDAYLVASIIPTVFFANLFGTLRTTTIPVYTRSLGQDHAEAGRLAQALFHSAGLLSFFSAAAGLLLAPYLVKLLAPGFSGELYLFTVQLARMMLLAVPFLALASVATPLLHAHGSFLLPAAIGFPYNAALIAAVFLFGNRYGAVAAAAGFVIAVAGQFFLQYPALLRRKILAGEGGRHLYHPGVKEIALLTAPVLLGLVGAEINLIIDRILASGLAEGSIAALNFANRLKSLPDGLFAASLLTVFYPQLARLAAEGKREKFKESLNRTGSAVVFLLLPSVVGFIVLNRPIVEVLFQRGAFDARAVTLTSTALFYYSFGLVFKALGALLVRAFFSLGDTKTPLLITFAVVGINITLNLLLIGPMGHAGLALATSLASVAGLVISFLLLCRKIGGLQAKRFCCEVGKPCVAALLMGVFLHGAAFMLAPLWAEAAALKRAALLSALIACGALLYGGLCYLFSVQEMRYACGVFKNRFASLRQGLGRGHY